MPFGSGGFVTFVVVFVFFVVDVFSVVFKYLLWLLSYSVCFLFVMILMTGTISSLCPECHLDTDQSPLHSPHHIPPAQVTQVPSLHTSILSLSYFHFRTFKISLSYFHFRALTSQFCIHITIVSASTSYTGTFSFNLFPSLRFPPDFQTSNLLSKHASTHQLFIDHYSSSQQSSGTSQGQT